MIGCGLYEDWYRDGYRYLLYSLRLAPKTFKSPIFSSSLFRDATDNGKSIASPATLAFMFITEAATITKISNVLTLFISILKIHFKSKFENKF